MKKLVQVLIVLAILALLLPLSNQFRAAPVNSLTRAKPADPLRAKAYAILGAKCADCHTAEGALPFYAALPIVGKLIKGDIQDGLKAVNYQSTLAAAPDQPAGEVLLAKTEREITSGDMPPLPYLLLHWHARLTAAEQATLRDWIHAERAKHYATAGVAPQFQNELVQPLPAKLDLDVRKVALGNKLFHDKRLSKDNTLSCASCHDLAKGGTDQAQYSTGVGQKLGGINSPTVFNSAFQSVMFWDGRAPTLEAQADGPVNNPDEMASNWQETIPKLQQDAELTAAFNAVYPQGYSKETITEAIAMFERSLLTPARFDNYLRGQTDAITAAERRGYELFKEHGCACCHVGKALGGQSYEPLGRAANYFADRGKPTPADDGRFSVTKNEADRHKFKVPTLRNVAITFPYLHDGMTSDLAQVVKLMAKYQNGDDLAAADNTSIVAFLHTLTGTYDGKPLGK
jgi:cytochrome c peroxidase